MTLLISSCLAFILLHLGVSGSPVREMLRTRLGANGYLGLYSLLALASLAAMIYSYTLVPHTEFIWLPSEAAYKITKVILLFSIILIVMGSMSRNPTAVNMEQAVNDEPPGTVKITRHPIQWGILLYALGHLIANGDIASIVFFSTLMIVSGAGMISMDARKKQLEGEAWKSFFQSTSLVPFAATLSGRNKLEVAEINWLALGIGIALYVCVYWFHNMVSGGSSLF